MTTRHRSGVSAPSTIDAIRKAVAFDAKRKRKGVAQLAENLKTVLDGGVVTSSGEELDVSSKQLIIPIIVWFEEYAGNPEVREMLQSEFDAMLEQRGIVNESIGPLLLFTSLDVEMFERIARKVPAEKLLREFSQFVKENPRHVCTMFRSFVHIQFPGQQAPLGLVDEAITELSEWKTAEHQRRVQELRDVRSDDV